MLAIPVRHGNGPIAVLTREWSTRSGRQPGELERTYLEIFGRFAGMIRGGLFPFPGRVADSSISPRVGDGVLVIDDDAKVRYASPNAVSALHRVGIGSNSVGQTLSELGFTDSAVRQAFERGEPVVEEFDQTAEVTLLARCMPLIEDGEKKDSEARNVTGAVLLLRDVSELRRRDRLILSKDATIREIHHRVKNNLQTISSLLRLQVTPTRFPRGQGRRRRVGASYPHDCARARDSLARAGRRCHFHRDRPTALAPRRGQPPVTRPPRQFRRARRRWSRAGHGRDSAVGGAH